MSPFSLWKEEESLQQLKLVKPEHYSEGWRAKENHFSGERWMREEEKGSRVCSLEFNGYLSPPSTQQL